MDQLFSGDESRRRRINLGGASTSASASHGILLQQARANRTERQQVRRRQEAAVTLQSLWRGRSSRHIIRKSLRSELDENITGIHAMRCLVLLDNDEESLGRWSNAVSSMGEESILTPASTSERESWLFLIRQLAVMLLHSVAQSPESQYSQSHLKVLSVLLSPPTIDRVLPSLGTSIGRSVAKYMLQRRYFPLLQMAVEKIPPASAKTSSTLPSLVPLLTAPLHIFPVDTGLYLSCFNEVIRFILTIHLLPNRLPLLSLSQFSAQLPLQAFQLIGPSAEDIIADLQTLRKINLLANLAVFMPPRYSRLSVSSLRTFLSFLTLLLSGLPSVAFEAPSDSSSRRSVWDQDTSSDDDDDDDEIKQPSSSKIPIIVVDDKTRSRLQTLASQSQIANLLAATASDPSARLDFQSFLMTLYEVWPSCKQRILITLLTSTGGGLVREIYRTNVRSSPLGKFDSPVLLADPGPEISQSWSPLLFLTDLYTQALLTMADDEFFASRPGTMTVSQAQRNPLTVDEVISFSRQLMTIAFVLIWYMSTGENDEGYFKGMVPGTSIGWDAVRDKVTGLVLAIHARDSRRPFTPPGHWLAPALDMASFAHIAVAEERKLSDEESATTRLPRSRSLSKRELDQISPRLNILRQIPFAIPFETRVHIFRQFVVNDMGKDSASVSPLSRTYTGRVHSRATVRRGHIATDGFDKLAKANLKGVVEITFIDRFGQEEAGIDGGGVFKEFFTELCKEVFDTDRGLWLATKKNELYPNPHSYAKESHSLEWYRFIGRILGKALYEGILVDIAFAGFFLAKWLGKQNYLGDLASLDPELYNGLLFLKNYTGDPEELSLTFAVVEDELGVARTVNLIPNGTSIPVTKENRLQYIYLMCHYRLTRQIRPQSEAFFEGLSEMIDPKWISMFNQQELQVLIGGVNTPVDVDDLRSNTNYGGLYDDDNETINAFWRVVDSFSNDQKRALLRFATSCSRPPLLGFKELQPKFSIRDAGTDQNRLPTASTCVNLLKLPRYTNEHVLREKLLQAITSNAGFDLS